MAGWRARAKRNAASRRAGGRVVGAQACISAARRGPSESRAGGPPPRGKHGVRAGFCGESRHRDAPGQKQHDRPGEPQDQVRPGLRRVEQHEFAIARDEEIDHSWSLSPATSRSRMMRRRSRLIGALLSSIDSPWQTGQRMSLLIARARAPAPDRPGSRRAARQNRGRRQRRQGHQHHEGRQGVGRVPPRRPGRRRRDGPPSFRRTPATGTRCAPAATR